MSKSRLERFHAFLFPLSSCSAHLLRKTVIRYAPETRERILTVNSLKLDLSCSKGERAAEKADSSDKESFQKVGAGLEP